MGKKNGTEQQQQEDLQLIYESLIPKNPELKEYGYDRFKEDMRDDNNLKDLFQSIAKKNPAVEQRGFEGFKSDMFPGQPDTVKKKEDSGVPSTVGSPTTPQEPDQDPISLLRQQYDQKEEIYNGLLQNLEMLQSNIDAYDKSNEKAVDVIPKYNETVGQYNKVRGEAEGILGELKGIHEQLRKETEKAREANFQKQEELFDALGYTREDIGHLAQEVGKMKFEDGSTASLDNIPADELSKMLTGKTVDDLKVAEEGKTLLDRTFGQFFKSMKRTGIYEMPSGAVATISNFTQKFREKFDRDLLVKAMKVVAPKEVAAASEGLTDVQVQLFDWAKELNDSGQDPTLVRSLTQIRNPLDIIDFVASNVGQGLIQIPAAVATRGVSAYAQEIGHTYLEGVERIAGEKQISPEQVIRLGMDEAAIARAHGLASGAMEAAGATKVWKLVSPKAFANDVRKKGLSFLEKAKEGFKTEFKTESAQSVTTQSGVERMTGASIPEAFQNVDYFQAFDEGVAGGVGGMGVTSMGHGVNSAINRLKYFKALKAKYVRNPEEAKEYEKIKGKIADNLVKQAPELSKEQAEQTVEAIADEMGEPTNPDNKIDIVDTPKEISNESISKKLLGGEELSMQEMEYFQANKDAILAEMNVKPKPQEDATNKEPDRPSVQEEHSGAGKEVQENREDREQPAGQPEKGGETGSGNQLSAQEKQLKPVAELKAELARMKESLATTENVRGKEDVNREKRLQIEEWEKAIAEQEGKQEKIDLTELNKKIQEQKDQPKPVKPEESKTKAVNYPVADISTDVERFQNREEDFSEESVKRIIDAVQEGTFDLTKFDEIRVWKDPKDGKTYVLAGHSRTEAFKRLQKMLEQEKISQVGMENLKKQGISDFKTIPSKDVSHLSPEAAEKYATEESNTLGTTETDLAGANLWRKKREKGESEASIRRSMKNRPNTERLKLFSYLNPKGQTIAALTAMQKAETEENQSRPNQIGEFIGKARSIFPSLTDSHENELYKWLTEGSGKNITTRNEFMDRLDNVVNTIQFQADPTQPLNLEKRITRGYNEQQIVDRRDTVKNRIKSLESEKYNKKTPPSSGRAQEINIELDKLNKELIKLNEDILKAKQGDKQQTSIFDQPAEKPAKVEEQSTTKKSETETESRENPTADNPLQREGISEFYDEDGNRRLDYNPSLKMPAQEAVDRFGINVENDGGAKEMVEKAQGDVRVRWMSENSNGRKLVTITYDYTDAKKVPNKFTSDFVAAKDDFTLPSKTTTKEPQKTEPQKSEEVKPAGRVDEGTEVKKSDKIKGEIDDLFKQLDKALGDRGKLTSGVDPQVAVIGAQIVGKYIELGVVKFAEIAKEVYDQYGEPALNKYFEALKAGYGSILATAEDTDNLTSLEAVRKTDVKQLTRIFNVSSTASDLESDSSRAKSDVPVESKDVQPTGETSRDSDSARGKESGTVGAEREGDKRVFTTPTITPGERSYSEFPESERPAGPTERAGRGTEFGRRNSDDGPGTQIEFGTTEKPLENTSVKGTADATVEERLKQQKEAESITPVVGDMQSIRDTLPMLLPHQHENVFKAEQRFFKPAEGQLNKGILFTDGTGTGKTYTGLGIAKRMQRMGKPRGIIVVPTDKKAKDWIEDGENLLIPVHQLTGIKDGGVNGANVTTYANFRENEALLANEYDWIIYDESHKIVSNKQGSATSADAAHRRLAISPNEARRRAEEKYQHLIDRDRQQGISSYGSGISQQTKDLIEKERQRLLDRTKVVFLSATPFSYHQNLRYGDGFLFTIEEGVEREYSGYNSGGPAEKFYMQNFGYRMRYNKLTQPEAGVDVSLMERMFADRMFESGVMSNTKIELEYDYSRDFVLADDKLGFAIDDGIKRIREEKKTVNVQGETKEVRKWPIINEIIDRRFTWLRQNQLLESIKAKHAIERVKDHLNLGRKVVVFHSYKTHNPSHPFHFNNPEEYMRVDDVWSEDQAKEEIARFEAAHPDLIQLDLSGLENPVETFKKAFGDELLVFNGDVPKKERNRNVKLFNNDDSGKNVLIVQMEAGKEGISMHDVTGKMPRAMINLALPYKPTDAIQSEGRTYRIGQKSDAIFEYMSLHANFEKEAYAAKINSRVKTAENLALGSMARNLEDSFKEGYKNPTIDPPSTEQGRGGKLIDKSITIIDDYAKAKTFYFGREKRNAKTKAREGKDYFATPEPVGLKMVEWLYLQDNEHALEPSAGHGAIGRWFNANTTNKFIEPSYNLAADLSINVQGEIINNDFESHHIVNKYNGIAMNPPFGHASKTAFDHFSKALHHLKEGGRVVAIVPAGPSWDKYWDKFNEDKENDKFDLRARIMMPSVTFERAGTSVSTQILIVDRYDNKDDRMLTGSARQIDLRNVETIGELFDELQQLEMPARLKTNKTIDVTDPYMTEKVGRIEEGSEVKAATEVIATKHTKNKNDIWVVKLNTRVDSNVFQRYKSIAKQHGGYYSTFRGNGAIPGFIFQSAQDANEFNSKISQPDYDNQGLPNNDMEQDGWAMRSKGRTDLSAFEMRVKNEDGKPFKMYQAVIDLVHKWNPNHTLGQGHNLRGAKGSFYGSGNIRVTGLNDLSVAMHELVHALDANNDVIKNFISDTKKGDKMRERLSALYERFYPDADHTHPLLTRMVEGYATLVQKYIERPSLIKKDYADLIDAFIRPEGKYSFPEIGEFIMDVNAIVKHYQSMSNLDKVGSRVVDETIQEMPSEKWTAKDIAIWQSFDSLYPIEKLAQIDGTFMTTEDVAQWMRHSNNATQIAYRNLTGHRPEFWNMDANGEWGIVHDFNFNTIHRSLKKRGLHRDFAAFLVARRIHFNYVKLNELYDKSAEIGTEEYINNLADMLSVDYEVAAKMVEKMQESLGEQIAKLEGVIENDQIAEDEATGAYEEGQKLFTDEAALYDAIHDQIVEFAHNPLVQLIDDDTYRRYKEVKGYAPFKVQIYDELVGNTELPSKNLKPGKTKVSGFIARKGTKGSPILDPFLGSMMLYQEVLQKGMKQLVYNKLLGMARKHPDMFQVLPLKTSPDPNNRFPQEKDDTIIMARENYKRVPILADKLVKQVIDDNYQYHNAHILEQIGVTMSQMFRLGTTGVFLQFFATNVFLDQFTGFVNSRNGFIPLLSPIRHLGPVALKYLTRGLLFANSKEAAYLKMYLFRAGTSQTFLSAQGVDVEKMSRMINDKVGKKEKFIDRWKALINFLSIPGNLSEVMTRGTEFVMAMKAGKHQLVAEEEAGRVSGSFHHLGAAGGPVGQSYVRSVPYFNAPVQILRNTMQTIQTPGGKKRAAFAALSLMAVAASSVAYLLDLDDDDEQKELLKTLTPEQLSKYLYLPNPFSKRSLIQIRIPEQFGFLSATLTMLMLDSAGQTKYKWTDWGDAGTAFLPTQLNMFKPMQALMSALPPLPKATLEVIMNRKTWPNVRDIDTDRDMANLPEYRYNEYTSPAAKWLGKQLQWSPKRIDHFLEQTFGRAIKYATGKPGAYDFAYNFHKELYMQSSRQVQYFYEVKLKNDQKVKAYMDDRKEFTEEEIARIFAIEDLTLDIQADLRDYSEMDTETEQARLLRNAIFDKIRKLETLD